MEIKQCSCPQKVLFGKRIYGNNADAKDKVLY